MKNKMFPFFSMVVALVAALLLVSCDPGSDEVQPIPAAYVTLYNASPNSPDLDIVVDNRQINTYPFEYSAHTGYLRFYTGTRNIKFSPYNAHNVIADTTVTLLDKNVYSLFIVDSDIIILNDSSDAVAQGKAKVRIINLSPDAAPVALREKDADTPLTENLAFKDASGFIEVEGKTYNLEVVSSGSEPTLTLSAVNLAPGTFHTIVVRGYRTPPTGNTNVISAQVLKN